MTDPKQKLPEGKTCRECCRVLQCFNWGAVRAPFDDTECKWSGGSAFVLNPTASKPATEPK